MYKKKTISIPDVSLHKMKVNGKQLRNILALIILIILMFWEYLSSLHMLWELKQDCQYAMLSYENMEIGFNRESAMEVLEQNGESDVPMRFAFWEQKDSGTVAAVGLRNSAEAEVMAVCGRTDILYMDTAVLDVKSLKECLVSSSLAFLLFGNSNVVGLEVTFKGEIYEIAGVVDSEKIFFVYEPDENDTVTFDRVTIYGDDMDNAEELSVRFKGQYMGWKSINYRLLVSILSIVVLIIPIGMGTFLLWQFKKCYNKSGICMKNKWARRYQLILWCIKSVVVLWLLALIIGIVLDFPLDMIPDRWSNFEFWTKWWDGVKELGTQFANMEKHILDRKYITAFVHGLGYQLIAVFSGILSIFLHGKQEIIIS